MPKKSPWKNFEYWKDYGIEKKYNKLKITKLIKSNKKKERAWARKGKYENWLNNFNFEKRKTFTHLFKTKRNWLIYGRRNDLDRVNVARIQKSENKTYKSWYRYGLKMKWTKNFKFQIKRHHKSPYTSFEKWETIGLNRKYNHINPTNLARSNKKEDRAWYRAGSLNNWINNFSFIRIQKQRGYWSKLENVKEELSDFLDHKKEFPSIKDLVKMGRSSLSNAINKNHGGVYEVKEKIGYNESKRQELALELELILGEI